MSTAEYSQGAAGWRRLANLEPTQAIALSCRGSGNPAVLAWLAEALDLEPGATVIDIGGGLGGTGAWLHAHYDYRVSVLDPVPDACRCARKVFELPAVIAGGDHLPLRNDGFEAALLLGVLSVVDDPVAVLTEAHRVAQRLGLLVYVSTEPATVGCGGSKFPTVDELSRNLQLAGWDLEVEPTSPSLPAPPPWNAAVDAALQPPDPDESAVAAALESGLIEARVAVAKRAS